MSAADTLSRAVREIEPILRQHAPAAERDRRLTSTVAQAMQEAGLYRLWRPKALGGLEIDPVTAFRVVEQVSRIDSAAGWNLMLCSGLDMFGPWFDDDVAKDIFTPDAILGGAFNPTRKAVPVEGGYRVSGRTPFVSGAHQTTVFFGLANIFDNGEMRLGPGGAPETLLTACPASQAEIVDHWNTMGMRGTGSHDVNLTDVFVPLSRAIPWKPLEKPGHGYEGPLYRLTVWPAIAILVPPALGIARAAIEEAIELITTKTPAYTTKMLKERPVVQAQLARAQAKLDAARAYLYNVFELAWAEAVATRPITIELKAKMQLASTNAVIEAAQAVDLIYEIAGSSGFREEYPFARHFRDIHVITQHGFINASKLESVGQIMLGLEPEWPFFAF